MFNDMLNKAILKSQRCQRNWNLDKEIPEEDLAVIKTAVTSCPSKQNITFYKPYFITNREHIERIHKSSMGAFTVDSETGKGKSNTNSQLLANLLVVLVEDYDTTQIERNPHIKTFFGESLTEEEYKEELFHNGGSAEVVEREMLANFNRDRDTAVGIAAGYMNLTASLMGYSTGCCQCFSQEVVQKILGVDGRILLIMGIGFADETRPRREHHKEPTAIFKTLSKNIQVSEVA
jgi:nitroreductase